MQPTRSKKVLAAIVLVAAPFSGGCVSPLAAPIPAVEARKGAAINSTARPNTPRAELSADPTSAPPDMVGVLDKIQQVRAMDPAAEQKLLDELRRVPASTWPRIISS
jgi:hypothetical protein